MNVVILRRAERQISTMIVLQQVVLYKPRSKGPAVKQG